MSGQRRSRQQQGRGGEARERRQRRPGGPAKPPPIPLTEAGVPAALPGALPPSGTVLVSPASRVRYPWLPRVVIAGSVWRGPAHEKVKVDANGDAAPWPPPRP